MTLEVKCDIGAAVKKLTSARGVAQSIMPQVFQEFYRWTPVAQHNGGNARRNTRLNGNRIEARYPYAQVLDDGRSFRDGQMRGSDQAPIGMSRPALTKVAELVQAYIKKVNGNG